MRLPAVCLRRTAPSVAYVVHCSCRCVTCVRAGQWSCLSCAVVSCAVRAPYPSAELLAMVTRTVMVLATNPPRPPRPAAMGTAAAGSAPGAPRPPAPRHGLPKPATASSTTSSKVGCLRCHRCAMLRARLMKRTLTSMKVTPSSISRSHRVPKHWRSMLSCCSKYPVTCAMSARHRVVAAARQHAAARGRRPSPPPVPADLVLIGQRSRRGETRWNVSISLGTIGTNISYQQHMSRAE